MISGMINPPKVIGFLAIFGDWDPSLAFVMALAVLVYGIGMRVSWDIFCSVIDNFGDIGVTWRLARQRVAEHDQDSALRC